MKIDTHFHVVGNGTDLSNVDNDVYFYADDNHHWFARLLYNMVEKDIKDLGADFNQDGKISTDEYFKLAYKLLTTSKEIDGIVLLALDAVYSLETGELDEVKTDLYVSNTFLDKKVKELNERLQNETPEFYAFMKNANEGGEVRLWADTSALSLSTRIPLIPEILETFPSEWLVHGSDFPIPIDAWPHLPWVTTGMTPEEYIEIIKTKNPLDRDVKIKQAHGFSDSIIGNSEKVLRLPSI